MKRKTRLLIIGGLFAALACAISLQASPAGFWKGAIALPNGQDLAIEVELTNDGSAAWSGKISIPAQGIRGFALAEVAVEKDTVGFAMEGIPGRPTFSGRLSEGEDEIEGDFLQGGQALKFSIKRTDSPEKSVSAIVPENGIPGEGVVGEWVGVLDAGPMKLRLALHVRAGDGGELSGELDSLDQGVNGLKVTEMELVDPQFQFQVKRVNGSFSGTLNEDGSSLSGKWQQNGQYMSLTFLRLESAAVIHRPQDPQPPFPYEEREVSFRNVENGIQLFGTLVIPDGEAPFPAVVFVSGSGPQDRDEAIAGHRPFAVLADALARCGIASLRYDDRGVGKSEGSYMNSTPPEFAQDAVAAVRLLETYPEIDTEWIGIVGHSEGGLVGPMAINIDSVVDFLILLAPPAERIDRLLMRQKSAIFEQMGLDSELIRKLEEDAKEEMVMVVDPSLSDEAFKAEMMKRYDEFEAEYGEALAKKLGLSREVVEASLPTVRSNWFRSLVQIDPADYLDSLTVPVLALFGEKDLQVDPEVNSRLLEDLLQRAGNEDFEIVVLDNLNHLFQNADTGSIMEYSQIEETFDPDAMGLICRWIENRRR